VADVRFLRDRRGGNDVDGQRISKRISSKNISNIILVCVTAITASFFLLTIDRGLTSWLIVNIGDCVLVVLVIVFLQRVVRAESSDSQHPVGIVVLLFDSYPQSDSTITSVR
jgi:DNA integrity scanning protein DisA with diadenylate cyclase activity